MAQQLRAPDALPEDLSLVPGTHSFRDLTVFQLPQKHHSCAQTYTFKICNRGLERALTALQEDLSFRHRQCYLLLCCFSGRLQHTAHRRPGNQAIFIGRIEDAPQTHQDFGLEGVAFAGKTRHDRLNLHGCDVPEAVTTDVGKDVLVQNIFDRVQAILTEIRLLVKIVPHLGEVSEGFLAANVHARLNQDLGLQNLFIQFFLGLGAKIFTGPIGELNCFGKVLIGFC